MLNFQELDAKANKGQFSTFDAEVMLPEIEKLQPGSIYLEIGVDRGKSLSLARMVAQRGVFVCGVDLQENPKIKDTLFYQGNSQEIAKVWDMGKISILFIDGDHSYEGCRADIDSWYPHLKEDAVIFFHDCDETSPGVVQAVAEAYSKYACKDWKLFKRTDKNTSMSAIWI